MAKRAIKSRTRVTRKAINEARRLTATLNEPIVKDVAVTDSVLGDALNWYNLNMDNEKLQKSMIDYLKLKNKLTPATEKILNSAPSWEFGTYGAMCRMLANGAKFPRPYLERLASYINNTIRKYGKQVKEEEGAAVKTTKPVVNVRQRMITKADDLIADVEDAFDVFYTTKKFDFNIDSWLVEKSVSAPVAEMIAKRYGPLFEELNEVIKGKDKELVAAYSSYTKSELKLYQENVRKIIVACEQRKLVTVKTRKQRTRKVKPATQIVAKMKFQKECTEPKVTSIAPETILTKSQLWVYNTKTRFLGVYNASGPAGLMVKGSTLTGYDTETSISKKLRKPSETLQKVLDSGKPALKRVMDDIRTKNKALNGRINKDTILLKVIA